MSGFAAAAVRPCSESAAEMTLTSCPSDSSAAATPSCTRGWSSMTSTLRGIFVGDCRSSVRESVVLRQVDLGPSCGIQLARASPHALMIRRATLHRITSACTPVLTLLIRTLCATDMRVIRPISLMMRRAGQQPSRAADSDTMDRISTGRSTWMSNPRPLQQTGRS